MQNGHFELRKMTLGGRIYDLPIVIKTVTGVILQCPGVMTNQQIQHLCDLAQNTPDYPVDLSAWMGPPEDRRMIWNARIYWRA